MQITETKKGKRYDVRLQGSLVNILLVGFVTFLRERPFLRFVVTLFGGMALLIGTAIFLFRRFLHTFFEFGDLGVPLLTAGFGMCLASVFAWPQFLLYLGEPPEVEERREAEMNLGSSRDPYAFLELDSKRLNEYYAINQSQARGSFRWAVFAMFCGLGTIIAGFWFYYLRDQAQDKLLTAISTAAGALVNVISGLYLYLHNKTQRRSLFYYGQLVRLQQLGLAIRLAESHDDAALRAQAKNSVIKDILTIARETALHDVAQAAKEGGSDTG